MGYQSRLVTFSVGFKYSGLPLQSLVRCAVQMHQDKYETFHCCKRYLSTIVLYRQRARCRVMNHPLGTRLRITSSDIFALSPKRRSRMEGEVATGGVLFPASATPTRCTTRTTFTRRNRTVRNIDTGKEGRRRSWETKTSVRIQPCSSRFHSRTHDF